MIKIYITKTDLQGNSKPCHQSIRQKSFDSEGKAQTDGLLQGHRTQTSRHT